MATQSRILAWRILWIEESSGLQSMGSQNLTGLSVSPREGQLFHREHRRGEEGQMETRSKPGTIPCVNQTFCRQCSWWVYRRPWQGSVYKSSGVLRNQGLDSHSAVT